MNKDVPNKAPFECISKTSINNFNFNLDFKLKNPLAGESRKIPIQVHQMTKALSPHLIESHDQTNRTFRVTNVNLNNPGQILPKIF